MRIILASQSPYRQHALDVLGLDYETIPSHVDESAIRHDNPGELAQLLSNAKAEKVAEENPNSLIIGADLFVVHNNKILEKPHDEAEAKEMLLSLSANTFEIVTGLVVYNAATKKLLSSADVCRVRFRELSDFEIDDYIKRFPVVNFAAAFESDGLLRFAEHIEGSYNFRTAIPVDKLVLFLRENGVEV